MQVATSSVVLRTGWVVISLLTILTLTAIFVG
jgi:hypothetical protein